MTEKIAVVAPMARASVITATAVKPRFFRNMRSPKRKSCASVPITCECNLPAWSWLYGLALEDTCEFGLRLCHRVVERGKIGPVELVEVSVGRKLVGSGADQTRAWAPIQIPKKAGRCRLAHGLKVCRLENVAFSSPTCRHNRKRRRRCQRL